MRVLGLTDPESGVGYHRIMYPCAAIPDADCFIRNFWDNAELEKGIDIVYYNRLIKDSPDEILDKQRQFGFKIIVDIDDYWNLDRNHIIWDYYHGEEGLAEKMIRNIRIADAVTCTHERLAEKIREYNPNVYVIPNALMYDLNQFNSEKTEDEAVRFIYVGGVTHKHDVGILRGSMQRVWSDKALRDKIRMVFCGYNEGNAETKEAYDFMLSSFTNGLRVPTEIRPAVEVWQYMDFYRHADVSLIPLRDTTFNSMKSNLKILEAAAKYLPVIVSKVHPYLDFPSVSYVEKQGDWYKHIKNHADSKSMRQELGQQLGEYCREHYNLANVSKLRKQIFEEVCSKEALSYWKKITAIG